MLCTNTVQLAERQDAKRWWTQDKKMWTIIYPPKRTVFSRNSQNSNCKMTAKTLWIHATWPVLYTYIVIQISWKKTLSKHLYCNIWHYLIVSAPSNHTQPTQGISPCSQNLQEENKNISLLRVQNTHLGKPLQEQGFSKPNKLVSKLTSTTELPTLKISQQLHGGGHNSTLSPCIYAWTNLPVG